MNLSQAKSKLNIRLGDTDNFALSSEEKDEILQEAWDDAYVVKTVWDSSLTFDIEVWQYAFPSGLTTVKDIYVKRSSSEFPEKIDSSLWEVVGGYIQFKPGMQLSIPDTYGLLVKGNYKYTTSDTITETNVQEYVLNLAQFRAIDILLNKKLLRFLKNDTSVAELVAARDRIERKIAEYRQRLPKEYEVA